MDYKKLQEQRDELAKAIVQYRDKYDGDESHEWNAENEQWWTEKNAELDKIDRKLERYHALESADCVPVEPEKPESRNEKPAEITNETRMAAFSGWANFGCRSLTQTERDAVQRLDIDLQLKEMRAPLCVDFRSLQNGEYRAQSIGTATAGGHLTDPGFVAAVDRAMLQFSNMRAVSEVLRTRDGSDIDWPTVDDTSNSGSILTENTAVSETDVVFGNLTLQSYMYTSDLVRASIQLMQDDVALPQLPEMLGSLLGERIARAQNAHFTTGTGSSQPNGIVTASSLGDTAASATAIAADEVIDLLHSVDVAYRDNARFMMHDNIAAAVRKLKDSNNQYLWGFGLNGAMQNTLLGFPVVLNNDMQSTIATATRTIIFGDLSKYKIRDVAEVILRRLDERYADSLQVGFLGFHRTDGDLINTAAVKHLLQA